MSRHRTRSPAPMPRRRTPRTRGGCRSLPTRRAPVHEHAERAASRARIAVAERLERASSAASSIPRSPRPISASIESRGSNARRAASSRCAAQAVAELVEPPRRTASARPRPRARRTASSSVAARSTAAYRSTAHDRGRSRAPRRPRSRTGTRARRTRAKPRGDDTLHALVPAFAGQHERPSRRGRHARRATAAAARGPPPPPGAARLCSSSARASARRATRVLGQQQLERLRRVGHAARGVEPRGEREGDRVASRSAGLTRPRPRTARRSTARGAPHRSNAVVDERAVLVR